MLIEAARAASRGFRCPPRQAQSWRKTRRLRSVGAIVAFPFGQLARSFCHQVSLISASPVRSGWGGGQVHEQTLAAADQSLQEQADSRAARCVVG
jgi:hypothetical protein